MPTPDNLTVLKVARELIEKQYTFGTLYRIDGRGVCYCSLGAVCAASGLTVNDMEVVPYVDINPEVVALLAEEALHLRNEYDHPLTREAHSNDVRITMVNDASDGQRYALQMFDAAINKLENKA